MNHYKRYCKIMTTVQDIVSNELKTSPDPPTILQYIEMIDVLNRAVNDIKILKDELRIR